MKLLMRFFLRHIERLDMSSGQARDVAKEMTYKVLGRTKNERCF